MSSVSLFGTMIVYVEDKENVRQRVQGTKHKGKLCEREGLGRKSYVVLERYFGELRVISEKNPENPLPEY